MASRDGVFNVLLVCTGNTCRSPMAAGALTLELKGDSERVEVVSAGTGALEGEPATAFSIAVAAREGVDLSGHRSHGVTREMLQRADLVLGMESSHREAAIHLGASPARTFVISEWPTLDDAAWVVSDPFGGSIEAYEECWRRIRRHVQRVAPRVAEAARSRSL